MASFQFSNRQRSSGDLRQGFTPTPKSTLSVGPNGGFQADSKRGSEFLGRRSLVWGFTLIELLVVISIIGLLSSIVFASLNTARQKGRNAKVRAEVVQIIKALELARDASPNGKFPGIEGNWQCLKPSGTCWRGNYSGNTTITDALKLYLPSIPKPPVTDSSLYMYDAYLYLPNYTGTIGSSPPGTYLIWAQEGLITNCSGYYAGNYDSNLYYCYQLVSPL